jgi:hypothetical protein
LPPPVAYWKSELDLAGAMNRKALHRLLNVLFGIGSFFNAIVFPVVLKTEPTDLTAFPFLRVLLTWLQGRIWWLWPVVFVLTISATAADKKFCDRWGYDAVKEMLEALREKGFPANTDQVHYHRVTLFRRKQWHLCWRMWPWSGWLIPVARSGHTTLNPRTSFLAPGDDPDKAEGIAGRCWSTKNVVLVPGEGSKILLPDLHAMGPKSRDTYAPKIEYAKATFVSVDWVMKKQPHSRSFLGIPVVVMGEPWGVIVVDSQMPEIKRAKEILDCYNEIARPFIKCLERLP